MAGDVIALLIAFGITFYGFGTFVLAGIVRDDWRAAHWRDIRQDKRRAARFALAVPFWPLWAPAWGAAWLVRKAVLIVQTAELLPLPRRR